MSGRANQPRDLVWSLESFESPSNAMRFFEAFKGSFMIYSFSVEKLYCDYTTALTGPTGRRRMVVLPDFQKYSSIYNRIENESLKETSIHIYPVIKNGTTHLVLSGKSKSTGKLERLPIRQGLKALKMGYFDQGKMIPALMLGDLREFPEKKLPYLKLHHIDLAQLSELSEFERKDIQKSAWSNLEALM
jgi:hypothetical protein